MPPFSLPTAQPAVAAVEVADDGAATTVLDSSPGIGHGHASMRERAAICGGTVRIGPRAGGGYAVEARLPLAGSV